MHATRPLTLSSTLLTALGLLACSDGLPAKKSTTDDGGVSDASASPEGAADASAAPVLVVMGDASVQPGVIPSSTPSGTVSGDAGNGHSGANMGAPDSGGVVSIVGDPGSPESMRTDLIRGPGARGGVDFGKGIRCTDLSQHYRDDAAALDYVLERQQVESHCDAVYEENEVAARACAIPVGPYVSSGFTSMNDKEDWFQLKLLKGVTYTYEFLPTGYLSFDVGQPVGVNVDPLHTERSNVTVYRALTAKHEGRADVRVYNGTAGYRFRMLPPTGGGLVHDPNTYEPNNTRPTAAPVCVGVPVRSELTGAEDATDIYTIDLQQDVTYTLQYKPQGYMSFRLAARFNDSEREYAAARPNTFYVQEFEPTFPTTTWLELSAGSQYDFVILPGTGRGLVQNAQTHEPNNSRSTYYPLTLGQKITSEFLQPADVRDWDDLEDWYALPVEQGASYLLELSRGYSLARELTMTSGKQVTTVQALARVAAPQETFTAPMTGLLYIKLTGGVKAPYDLQVNKL